ncbi:DegT/DnrJ/EryC1/StrS family aminotransferase [Parvularcula dongshanensis]|uniref:dTDP-4-amino-4,6-dideoxygalactose transaminase n=1 Tax=Parvularcula dongshanensis TaxID=1173995 RepID=A0A840I354_9PROT|nr:DegT/DnrJ/EryC1/StrS family aminotransferase [Parvularcula dongshanensis]MBB4658703.1 dTDP-4-amino-4,6-dideoxygalactose transaminase [Parvularcula dongshanensis]
MTMPATKDRPEVGPIAFIDLKAQQAQIRERVEARLMAVLDHGRYIAGPEIEELETLLAEKVGAKHCVACSSGTDALIIPMMAMGLNRGDAVFLPAFTYNATANAVIIAGGVPVFCDVDPDGFNIDPEDLKARIIEAKAHGLTPRAVCAVDLFGVPAPYAALRSICEEEGLALLGDAAQSFGGQQARNEDWAWVGSLAPITATSFFPGKALGGYGDGGAIFTDDDETNEVCQSIRWHGTDAARAESVRVGLNGRMASFQAAVLLEKAAIFWDELEARRRVAAIYDEGLKGLAAPQAIPSGTRSGYGYYTVSLDDRDHVREKLGEAGVPTAVYYKTPLHRMKAFAPYPPYGPLPNCEAASSRVLSLPMHPYLTDEQARFVVEAFAAAVA